jgi:hypothetical protein
MAEFIGRILAGQYQAALCMLNDCLAACPPESWDAEVGKYPFWQVAYHALCFADLYLTPHEKAFQPRTDFHPAGWREFEDEYPSRRFEKSELAAYLAFCREKAATALVAETATSLEGPSGHARRNFSRGELHVFIRHLQHHVGQLSALLRRSNPAFQDLRVLPWIGSGWQSR